MKKFLFLIMYFPFAGFAQNLTGTWVGYSDGAEVLKMVITHKGDSLYGYTYDEGGGYCKALFSGRYDKINKRLTGRGTKMLEGTPNHVLVSYNLYYAAYETSHYLRSPLNAFSGRTVLKRISKKVDSPYPEERETTTAKTPPAKTTTPAKKAPIVASKPPVKQPPVKTTTTPTPSKPDVVTSVPERPAIQKIEKPVSTPELKKKDERSSKLVKMIVTHADTLRLMVYDNGEVDGDTVTIFFNNRIVLNKFRITEKGKEVLLPLTANTDHTIELFANNLGTIPPNTALLIITDGKERHELRASYDLETNAKIIIRAAPDK